jgi:crotonobetainyl-CoA:carnitine CoA-transferase CaiB-like acyl-CoA transferase
LTLAVGSERLWSAFCQAINRPELLLNGDYSSNANRISHRIALESSLQQTFLERTAAEWLERLQAAGIPCSLVRNFEDVALDPQCEVRRMFPLMNHPTAGPHRVTGTPVKLSETPGGPSLPAPLLGQHTAMVLQELFGIDPESLERLAAKGVIFQS